MQTIADKKVKFGKTEMEEVTGKEGPPGLEHAFKVWHGVRIEKSDTIDFYVSIMRNGKINYQEHGKTRIGIDFPADYTAKVNLNFNQKGELIGLDQVAYVPEVDVKTLLRNMKEFLKNEQVQAELRKVNMPSLK